MVKRVMVAALTLVAASSAAASSAAAQGTAEGRWSVTFGAGTAPTVSGIYHEGGAGTVLSLPTQVQERDSSDIYNTAFAMRVGAEYTVMPQLGVTGSFLYSRQDAEGLSVGNVAGLDLRSQFGEYRDWGIEGGIRWHFAPNAADQSVCWRRGRRSPDRRHARDIERAGGGRRPRGHAVLRRIDRTELRRRFRCAVHRRPARSTRRRSRASMDWRSIRPRRSRGYRSRELERLEQPMDGPGQRDHQRGVLRWSPSFTSTRFFSYQRNRNEIHHVQSRFRCHHRRHPVRSLASQSRLKAPPQDIVDTAVAAGSFNTLAKALQAAGLVETLKGKGPFTVFAPTDAAFAKLPAGALDDLLKPENKQKLTQILTYHVVSGKVTEADVTQLKSAKTVNGGSVRISAAGGSVMVDNSRVLKADVMASNGVIHVIDSVSSRNRRTAASEAMRSFTIARRGIHGLFCCTTSTPSAPLLGRESRICITNVTGSLNNRSGLAHCCHGRDRLHRYPARAASCRCRLPRTLPRPLTSEAARPPVVCRSENHRGAVRSGRHREIRAHLEGCAAAFYLVHSMQSAGEDYAERDRAMAARFAEAAAATGVRRIIYLGGLGDSGERLSAHLESRREVERVLAAGPVPVTAFRAALIIGSGSASFEILRYLAERLPVLVTPRWVRTECQPISVQNVLHYLVECLAVAETTGRTLEIGGADVLESNAAPGHGR